MFHGRLPDSEDGAGSESTYWNDFFLSNLLLVKGKKILASGFCAYLLSRAKRRVDGAVIGRTATRQAQHPEPTTGPSFFERRMQEEKRPWGQTRKEAAAAACSWSAPIRQGEGGGTVAAAWSGQPAVRDAGAAAQDTPGA